MTRTEVDLTQEVQGILPVVNGGTGSATIPTWNQNTTGSAAKLTTPQTINGVPFDGTAPITVTPTTTNYQFDVGTGTRKLIPSLARALATATTPGVSEHLIIGDSMTSYYNGAAFDFPNSWYRKLKGKLLASGFLDGGTGMVATNEANSGGHDPRWAFSGTTDFSSNVYVQLGTSSSTATFTSDIAGTIVDVIYSNAGGSFSVKIDGAAAVAVTASGQLTIGTYTVTGLTAGVHTVLITATSGTAIICAAQVRNTTGIRFSSLGKYGLTAAGFIGNGGYIKDIATGAVPSPDVLHIAIGANDMTTGGATAAATVANVQSIRNLWPNADVILYCEPITENNEITNAAYGVYTAGLRTLAGTLGCPLVDWNQRYGGAASVISMGYVGPDNKHPNALAQIDMGNTIYEGLLSAAVLSTLINLSSSQEVQGILPAANGGTGQASLTGLPLPSPTLTDPVLVANASPSYAAGKLVFDSINDCLTFFSADTNVSLQVGQEIWLRCRNVTGSTIGNGAAVYASGADAGTGLTTVAPALATAVNTAQVVGVTTEPIANNTTGYVTVFGVVHGLNTAAFTAGAALYVDPATAGALNASAPTGTNYRCVVGYVTVSSSTVGSIYVTPSSPVIATLPVTQGGTGATTLAGLIGIAQLSATGTPSSTTVLYGDNTWKTASGGSGSTTPTANTLAEWDANKNLSAANLIEGFSTTVTSGTTVTLTIASNETQVFTGSVAQTVVLPTTSVPAGLDYTIINLSTAALTVESSTGAVICLLAGSAAAPYVSAIFTALVATPTTAANWSWSYSTLVASGKAPKFNNSITFAGTDATTMTFPGVSGTVLVRSVLTITTATTLAAVAGLWYFYLLGTGGVPTLPTAVANACTYTIKNTTLNAIAVATTSTQTIDGNAAPYSLAGKASITLVSDNANWWIT